MLTYNSDISNFIELVHSESKKGQTQLIDLYGYNLYIPAYSSISTIRILINVKLRDIKNREKNLEIIKKSGIYTDEELKLFSKLLPDEIGEMTYEISKYPIKNANSMR